MALMTLDDDFLYLRKPTYNGISSYWFSCDYEDFLPHNKQECYESEPEVSMVDFHRLPKRCLLEFRS